MAAYWEYLRWGMFVAGALGAWRYLPLTIVRLVAAFTRSETRPKQCMEVLRLARRDAAEIPPFTPLPQTAKRRAKPPPPEQSSQAG